MENIYRSQHYRKIFVRKRAKIRNRYNQAPHLTQDTNGKVTTSQLDITNESQEVSLFPAGDHKAALCLFCWIIDCNVCDLLYDFDILKVHYNNFSFQRILSSHFAIYF